MCRKFVFLLQICVHTPNEYAMNAMPRFYVTKYSVGYAATCAPRIAEWARAIRLSSVSMGCN